MDLANTSGCLLSPFLVSNKMLSPAKPASYNQLSPPPPSLTADYDMVRMPVGMKVGSGVALQPVWTVTVSVGIWQPLVHEVVMVLVLVVGQQSVLLGPCQLLS